MEEPDPDLPTKLICWDMDETLGHFRGIAHALRGEEAPPSPYPIGIRCNIAAVLEQMYEEGFVHFITTGGGLNYAGLILELTGLDVYFAEVLADDALYTPEELETNTYERKRYGFALDLMEFSEERAKSDMIIIGDLHKDAPYDLDGVVFIEHESGFLYDAHLSYLLIHAFLEAGDGSFNKGFNALYRQDETVSINNNIQFKTEIRYFRGNDTPTIYSINAEDYIKRLEEI